MINSKSEFPIFYDVSKTSQNIILEQTGSPCIKHWEIAKKDNHQKNKYSYTKCFMELRQHWTHHPFRPVMRSGH